MSYATPIIVAVIIGGVLLMLFRYEVVVGTIGNQQNTYPVAIQLNRWTGTVVICRAKTNVVGGKIDCSE
jgi:hypothetical protein